MLFRIAEALGQDPDIIDRDMMADRFMEWREYFDWIDTRRTKEDYYLAQIAGYASKKERWRVREFFMPTERDRHGKHIATAVEAAKMLEGMYGKS